MHTRDKHYIRNANAVEGFKSRAVAPFHASYLKHN